MAEPALCSQTPVHFHTAKLHFPGFFVVKHDHMTKFWAEPDSCHFQARPRKPPAQFLTLSDFHHLPTRCRESTSRFWSPGNGRATKWKEPGFPKSLDKRLLLSTHFEPKWDPSILFSPWVQGLFLLIVSPPWLTWPVFSILGRENLKPRSKSAFLGSWYLPQSLAHSRHSTMFVEWTNDVLGSCSDLFTPWPHDLLVPLY